MERFFEGNNFYRLTYEEGQYTVDLSVKKDGDIDTLSLKFTSDTPVMPPVVRIFWTLPHIDVQGIWVPSCGVSRQIPLVWGEIGGMCGSDACHNAPVLTMFSSSGMNRQTFSCSDAYNNVRFGFGLREEDSNYLCNIFFFDGIKSPIDSYEATVKIDRRNIRYEDAISDVVNWWASMPEYTPMPVPEECISPVYSTWYSFHQMAYGDEIEKVLKSCEPLGFSSVIVDDGWQMEDSSRTYNYCGDWEVNEKKIADMKAHVKRVHDMGMKYFLWYSVPYVGKFSRAYTDFKGKFLDPDSRDVVRFDPRYPDVREYLVSKYEYAIREWDIDGFKLDFIDSFGEPEEENPDAAPGKDFASVALAVDKLLSDIKDRLCALKPNIGIEFRQCYVGPLMRKYGNMFRAGDCANDTALNKIRTIDIRLVIGDSPTHADMITWNPEDTVEAAALQLVSTAFAVPQISVRPYRLPENHNIMLKNWLEFWKSHKNTLLFGKFRAHNPELMYSQASAEDESCFIAFAYANGLILRGPESFGNEAVFVNASGEDGLAVSVKSFYRECTYTAVVENCMGEVLSETEVSPAESNIFAFDVPVAGRVTIRKK